MRTDFQLLLFSFLSVFIHVVIFAFMPLYHAPERTTGEIYQIVSVVYHGGPAANDLSTIDQQVEWLDTLQAIDTETLAPSDQPAAPDNTPDIKIPALSQSDFRSWVDDKIAEPVLADSLLIAEKMLTVVPPDMTDVVVSLDWQTIGSVHSPTVSRDKSDAKSNIDVLPDPDTLTRNEDNHDIQGPVGSRAVIFKPDPPIATVESGAVIRLKFWVLPDGTVGKIIPVIKENADLERIATNYLKQWRFSPLGEDQPSEDQWGIIPVKFTIY